MALIIRRVSDSPVTAAAAAAVLRASYSGLREALIVFYLYRHIAH